MKLADAEFQSEPSQSLYCPICQELFQDALVSSVCGHCFCASCIYQSLEREPKCPMCRCRLTIAEVCPNIVVNSLLRELQVFCVYRSVGCDTILKVDDADTHIQNCKYQPWKCPYSALGCSHEGPAIEDGKHLTECVYAQLKGFFGMYQAKISQLEDKLQRQAKELERLREFVRTNKTNPSVVASPSAPPKQSVSTGPTLDLDDISHSSPSFPQKKKWASLPVSCVRTFKHSSSGLTSLALDESLIYAGSYDGCVSVFSQTGLPDTSILHWWHAHKSTVWSLSIDEHRRILYTGGSDSLIKMWDISNLQHPILLDSFSEHSGKIYCLLQPLEDLLVSASSDKSIKLWMNGNCVSTLQGHSDNVNGISIFLSDRTKLLSASSDKLVKLWDLTTKQSICTFSGVSTEVLDVSNDDANLVFASTYDAMIQVWDKRTPNIPIAQLTGHNWEVWQVEYVDGILFSGSFDHSIRKWDTRMMSCIEILAGHKGYVHALKLKHHSLFSACADKTVKIWNASLAP